MRSLGRRLLGDGAVRRGSVLIEVMVAIVILGVFLGGLCTAVQRAQGAVADLRARAGVLSPVSLEASVAEAWQWGCLVEGAEWLSGPQMVIRPGEGCWQDCRVGVWCDGWSLGEWSVSAGDVLELAGAVWAGMTGQEVVIRLREVDGPWGPPWRTVVPDEYCLPGLERAIAVDSQQFDGLEESVTVMHTRALGVPPLVASWSSVPVFNRAEGVVLALSEAGPGLCSVESYGRTQEWVNNEGRWLDIYW